MLYNENSTVSGCAISLFRRVTITGTTIQTLIQLNKKPNWLVIEALSAVSEENWSSKIELELIRCLNNETVVEAAARALYNIVHYIELPKTITALKNVLNSNNTAAIKHAVSTLCTLTKLNLYKIAVESLSAILKTSNNDELRLAITETLGWATDNGLELLKITSKDFDPKVRQATINAIIGNYQENSEAIKILNDLSTDTDNQVQYKAQYELDRLS